ncbi:hypothetical protein F0562_015180 [Nyssa sinensis]|uniref:Protein SCAR n=1 Tax=Nyssa sinensis TaxID=561372 RepID=A0A5J4ZJG3_9ASTE|nr:hypothetical protein F0562_015180 [Nyssa sinensis]
MTTAEVQREKKIRKAKKKGSRWRNGETPDVFPTSKAKLHQLFLEERVENGTNDPARLVKLKRRLNGFPFDSRTGKSYMEKFLKTPSPEHKVVREISVSSPSLKLPPTTTSESRLEILEISTVSPDKESLLRKRSPCSSPEMEETVLRPSMDELNEEVTDGYSEVPIVSPNFEANNIVSTNNDGMNEKETVVIGESKMEGSRDGYQSDDIASEIDHYMDALASMESEMETDTECKAKNDLGSLNIEKQLTDSDENEEQRDLQTHFSDSQSLGNSTASDDPNSLSKKEISTFSFSDSLRNLAENTPADGDVSTKVVPSTEIYEDEIADISSDQHSVKEDIPATQPIEHLVPNGVCIEVAEIPSCRSEFAEPSSSSCLADVAPSLSPEVQGTSLMDAALVGLELDEISSNCTELVTGFMNAEENGTNLGDSLPSTYNLSDVPSYTGDDFLPMVSAENHPVSPRKSSSENRVDNVLQTEYAEDFCTKNLADSQINSPHSVILCSDTRPLGLALPELEIGDPDVKPDGIVSEVDNAVPSAGEIAVGLIPALDGPQTSHFSEQQFSEITYDVLPLELDSAAVHVSYSGEKSLDGAFNTADGEEIVGLTPNIDLIGKDAAPLEFPSDFPNSPDPASDTKVHVHLDDIVTETAQSEDVAVASAAFGTDNDDDNNDSDNENDVNFLSTKLINLQEESLSSLGDLVQNGLESRSCLPEHLKQSDTEKEVDQQAVTSPKLDSILCNTISSDHSYSELVNDVPDSSMAVEAKNGVYLGDATTVPSSSDHSDQDSESKSPQKSNLVENSENAVSSLTHCLTELRIPSEKKVELQADQFDMEFHHAGEVTSESLLHCVPDSSMAAAAENSLYLGNVTSASSEQKVELQADQFDEESHHAGELSSESLLNDVPDSSMAAEAKNNLYLGDATTVPSSSDQSRQDSESKSPQQNNLTQNSEDSVSSPTHCLTELRIPSEQKVELQADQFDEESHHAGELSSESLLNDVPESSMAAEAQNNLYLGDATTVPSSSDQSRQDSESKSPQQNNLTQNSEDSASSPTHCLTELRIPSQKVELQDDQLDVESHHAAEVSSESLLNDVPDSSMAAEAENSLYLRDASTVPPSSHQGGQDSESKSPQKNNLVDNSEDSASSPTHRLTEMRIPSERKVELQSDQLDVELHHASEISSESLFLLEQTQHPNHLDQERWFNVSSKCRSTYPLSQPLVSDFLQQSGSHKLDVSEQVRDPLSSTFPDFGLMPQVTQINLEEMPPLPPLPPMQWRMGKTQPVSLASQRDLMQRNMDPFPPILQSTADEKAQLGYPVKGGITQPSNSSLPLSAVKHENSQHVYQNAASYMMHSDPFSFQVPTMIDHGNNQDDFLTSGRTQSTNPFLTLPTIYNERPQHGFLASKGGTVQPSLNPFSTVTNTEDAPSTYAPTSLQEKLIQPLHQLAPDTCSEDGKLQSSGIISEVKEVSPSDTIVPPPMMEDELPRPTSKGESAWSSGASSLLSPDEDGMPNESQQMKLPRPRNPLIDAVAAHGKSKLRKVTERVRPQIGQKVDERDSLLEQIRTKSFNLKRTVITRPSIQGPKTNLKVAAILEKANAIRQALAGSDEDDDEDSWSDL